nr:HPP family protein [Kibdelosporangium sp. MJ126-NF4]CEL20017.1 Probable transmembrane protein [Kibdelosporangium sp. MJ126-NF4]CTQ97240.1 Probable transmembrane protein [Kibdelosporangium sp. MJ126-NF4]
MTVSTRDTQRTAVHATIGAFVTMALIGAEAVLTRQPLMFPSLGPTAFLLFTRPTHATASPRNTLLGHLIGVLAGVVGLVAFGQWHSEPSLTHMTFASAGAATLALALTCGAMTLFGLPHPPAGATTLIISLGVLHTPLQLVLIMSSVAVLTLLGGAINRLTGTRYPLWRARE